MASKQPTIVIIPGAWHTPSSYSKLVKALQSTGYEVHVPEMPSMNGTRPPDSDLDKDTAFIRAFVEDLINKGRVVAVLMHSYGGQVGSNALLGLGPKSRAEKGAPGGVSTLIYMCAFAMSEGCSMMSIVEEFGQTDRVKMAIDTAEDGTSVHRYPRDRIIGTYDDETEAQEYLLTLKRWNGKIMYEKIHRSAWKEIPTCYIHTTKDIVVPHGLQKIMVDRMQKTGLCQVRTVEIEAGHTPHLTALVAVKNAIDQFTGN
ncbi:alpha/beta-hydrolase [Nemania abortiva]|nr:alpha/beta-hydrolase [Nemania abortiva]